MAEYQGVRAVVLAGRSGTRLWPLSRLQSPKQILRLVGEGTLLEETVRRLTPLIDRASVLVVTNEETALGEGYGALAAFEKILEPAARNTAPAIGVAALRYALQGLDPVMVVLSSDHPVHRLKNLSGEVIRIIEAQVGSYVGEDDIQRFDDQFGRTKQMEPQ